VNTETHTFPIRYRIGSYNDGIYGKYRDATDQQVIKALQGVHEASGYHRDITVYVVRVWPETTTVPAQGRGRREVTYEQGEPAFGEQVTVYGRGQRYGGPNDAHVSFASGGGTPAEVTAFIEMLALATGLAMAANANPVCQECAKEAAERQARQDRLSKES
jgi:hypothetical protein